MSRTRIVKGKLTEIIGGDYNIYSTSNIVDNAVGEIREKGEEKGVGYGDSKDLPPPILIAKCIIHFRPNKDWKGEFGFDWLRIGDSKLKVDTNYNGIIGNYGSVYATQKGAVFTASNDKYNKSLGEFDSFSCIKGKYYVPKITLQKDKEIVIDIISEIEESPDKLHYAYDTNYFEIILLKKINTNKGKNYSENALKIKCIKSVPSDQSIRIIATKNKRMEKVGEIKILKNDHIINCNIIIIPVKYNGKSGSLKFAQEKDYVKNSFDQALVKATIENYPTELILGDWWSDLFFTTKDKHGNKVMDMSSYKSIHRYLDESFMKMKGNNKYSSYYRVYCLPSSLNLNGVAEDVGNSAKAVVVFQNRDNYTTMIHEILHAVGLHHTFDNSAQYTFKLYSTDNIMDYTHHTGKDRFTTTNWQWKLLRKNL